MKAVGCPCPLSNTDPDSLQDFELPKPDPQERDLLVHVEAVSVNLVDTKIRSSKIADPQYATPRVLGWDVAGVVELVGTQVSLFQPGDEVYYSGSLIRPGANSEYHVVDERLVAKKPVSFNMAEAVGLPLTAITAYEALFDRLGISLQGESEGKAILIIGGAGGVGSLAIQLAKIAKLHVIATASRPESQAWCRKMGADGIIDHTHSIPEQLQQLDRPMVEYIFNTSQTDQHWQAMCEAIKPQGRICGIVDTTESVDLNALKRKSATFVWEFMFTRSIYQTEDMIQQHHILTRIAEWVDEQKTQSTLTETLSPINAVNLRTAHAKLESGRMIGIARAHRLGLVKPAIFDFQPTIGIFAISPFGQEFIHGTFVLNVLFMRPFRGALPISCSLLERKLLRIPLLCKERPGEVESLGHRENKSGSGMKGFEESTSPFAPPYKGGEHQNAQPYVLPMLMLEEPNILRMIE